ncbi:MAG: GTPase Era [Desulforegulaceae bacterium]|nr:GTPase Era [Desulforegulaceae bacterium]
MIDSEFLFKDKIDFRAGYVSIIGTPNVGKSTLLNRLCGEKLAITADKPQTTRNKILAVINNENSQIVFLDTPGIHSSEKIMNKKIVEKAIEASKEADLILYVVDLINKNHDDEMIVEKLKSIDKKVILLLNKADEVKVKEDILYAISVWKDKYDFQDIIPVSAAKGDNLDRLIPLIEQRLPFSPPFYPEDFLTDMPLKFYVSEIIREKVFNLTHHEIPYSTAVTIDKFKESSRQIEIFANINIERDSQKGIVIGKKGAMLKEIGTQARIEIEEFTEKKVVLHLFVRVHKNWTRKPGVFKDYGIE